MSRRSARRIRLAVAAAVILLGGLAVHVFAIGAVGAFVADALYASFVAVLIAIVLPAVRIGIAPAIALVVCAAIELWQLTPVPAELSRTVPGAALVVGSTFSWIDLVAYAVGAAAAVPIEVWSRRASAAAAGSSRGGATTPSADAPASRPREGRPSR
ncbi:ribosomal maturation YjgA family protein [Leifsonia poae]|nr:DUF2809 domain-containing protein [Leifsonia poae]